MFSADTLPSFPSTEMRRDADFWTFMIQACLTHPTHEQFTGDLNRANELKSYSTGLTYLR